MTVDDGLFIARRLGFGLGPDEPSPATPRDWAMDQLRATTPLDFFGPDGVNMAGPANKQSVLLRTFEDACKAWGDFDAIETAQTAHFKSDTQLMLFMNSMSVPRWRDALALSMTAINGPTPVFERFWHFWLNHFAIATSNTEGAILQAAHVQAIRNRMTGKFSDLLFDAVANPAMMLYLDNVDSTGPHSRAGRSGATLNENLGRELLELHTVSPAAGYTQKDVVETALVLTGWAFYPRDSVDNGKTYGTTFNVTRHEPGTRTILGKAYPAKGKGDNQLQDLIADLAVHPATITHLSTKLARAFIADEPPQDSIERIAAAFTGSGGDMVAIHSAVVDEVLSHGREHPKLSTPLIWLLQAHKATGAQPTVVQSPGASMALMFKELGQPLDDCPQPNGFSDFAADWLSSSMLDRRVRAAYIVADAAHALPADALGRIADRLMGAGSDAAMAVRNAESPQIGIATLLTSPQFLWI